MNRKRRDYRVLAAKLPRLRLETLEGRLCPSVGSLVVGSFGNNRALRYDENSGALVDQLDPRNFGDLKNPLGGIFGPDGNLYVTSGVFRGNAAVLQYNGTTGAFQAVFASQNITSPRGILFGPDGNLYVANGNELADGDPASVVRFDGATGEFLDYFVAPNSGGLEHPSFMVFGPNGLNDGRLDLYIGSAHAGCIERYDGTTGAFKGVFVSVGSGGLNSPQGMVFGTDGNLYVASGNWFDGSNGPFYSGDFPPGAILRFEGPAGPNPGSFLGTFVPGGSGGLANPAGILFGPDPSGNGATDLYVANSALHNFVPRQGTSEVLRYDAVTGAFLGTFVAPGSGGLKFPTFITFTETDPTTLNYIGFGARVGTGLRSAAPNIKVPIAMTPGEAFSLDRISVGTAVTVPTVTDAVGGIIGDRRVNIADLGLFSLSIFNPANYYAAVDFNGDGVIDSADFEQFNIRDFTVLQ
jgi:hypothetical protein